MLRTPEPKEQARLLVQLLAQQGLALQRQKALDVVAQLHGHRNWNVMAAATAPAPQETATEQPQPAWVSRLVTAAQAVVSNADDSGCTDDLTVTSAQAVEELENALNRGAAIESQADEFTVAGFNAEDVLSVRPDLTPDEALQVLYFCDKHYDASIGLNWDRLEDNSMQCLGSPYAVEGVLTFSDGRKLPVVVELRNGRLHDGTLESLTQARKERRYATTQFGPMPAGTDLLLADGAVEVYMGDEVDVHGASSDDLRELCDELRAAGVTFKALPR